jgi:hypothetical protein
MDLWFTTWGFFPLTNWLVFVGLGSLVINGITLGIGNLLTRVTNQLLTGMILQILVFLLGFRGYNGIYVRFLKL